MLKQTLITFRVQTISYISIANAYSDDTIRLFVGKGFAVNSGVKFRCNVSLFPLACLLKKEYFVT